MPRISSRIGRKKKEETAKIVFMFPGQGVQALGMAKDTNPETLKGLLDQTAETLGEFIAFRLTALISPDALELPADEQKKMQLELRQTQNAQLAVFLVSYAQWLDVSGRDDFLMPDFILGHSLGECTAVCAAGALNFRDGLKFVFCRGILMQMATSLERAGMAVVGSEKTAGAPIIKTIERCLKGTDIEIANY
ncbi:MAG: acyltransferase domain-containing protein, partial [Patescibacteria group bacterium]